VKFLELILTGLIWLNIKTGTHNNKSSVLKFFMANYRFLYQLGQAIIHALISKFADLSFRFLKT
jgi:hypothetical protein